MVRIFGNAVGWPANAAKLSSVGLWLNASKSESMLASDDIHLDWCFSTNSLWSTRYFKELSNVGRVKSSVDDLNGTWYCKHESSLCATICWGSASVPRFVRWHVSWDVTFHVCLLLPYLPPPTAPQSSTHPNQIQPHFSLFGGMKKSTHLPGVCFIIFRKQTSGSHLTINLAEVQDGGQQHRRSRRESGLKPGVTMAWESRLQGMGGIWHILRIWRILPARPEGNLT